MGKNTQPLTVAQQIAQNAPFHPAAHHGRKEIQTKKDTKETEKLLKISNASASIVDQWMQDLTKKHNVNYKNDELKEPIVEMRQPRLGLGAKFLEHKKVVQKDDRQTKKLKETILKEREVEELSPTKTKNNIATIDEQKATKTINKKRTKSKKKRKSRQWY